MGKEEGVTQEFRELFFQSTVSPWYHWIKHFGKFLFRQEHAPNFTVFVLQIAFSKLSCFILPEIYFDLSHAAPVYTNRALT